MGDAIENLIALAGRIQVDSHKRTTKSGKVVDVEAYTRSPGSMSNADILTEMQGMWSSDKGPKGMDYNQKKNRYVALVNEQRKRIKEGKWDAPKPSGPTDSGAGNNPDHPSWEAKPSMEDALKKAAAIAATLPDLSKDDEKADNPWSQKTDKQVANMADLLDQDWGTPLDANEKQAVADAERRAGAERGTEKYSAWLDKVLGDDDSKDETPRKLDLKGDILAQYKSGQGMWNSKGQDDFGREALSVMDDKQLADALKWRKSENDKKNFGMSGAMDLKLIEQEIAKREAGRTKKAPVSDNAALQAVASRKKGMNASDLAYELRISNAEAMRRLMQQVEAGRMEKRGSKFVALSNERIDGYLALSREI